MEVENDDVLAEFADDHQNDLNPVVDRIIELQSYLKRKKRRIAQFLKFIKIVENFLAKEQEEIKLALEQSLRYLRRMLREESADDESDSSDVEVVDLTLLESDSNDVEVVDPDPTLLVPNSGTATGDSDEDL